LPTKGIENIGNSRQIAENRFFKLERKLRTNENLRIEYTRFMKKYEDLGYMIKILLRFSRWFTQSQFNSTINKFMYTSKHSVQ